MVKNNQLYWKLFFFSLRNVFKETFTSRRRRRRRRRRKTQRRIETAVEVEVGVVEVYREE